MARRESSSYYITRFDMTEYKMRSLYGIVKDENNTDVLQCLIHLTADIHVPAAISNNSTSTPTIILRSIFIQKYMKINPTVSSSNNKKKENKIKTQNGEGHAQN